MTDTGDDQETGAGRRATGGPPVVPEDLPEHSLLSYNPNRTRFYRPSTPSRTGGSLAPFGEEDTSGRRIETQFGPPPDRMDELQVEEVLDERHRLVKLIGRGGCGEVWEAVQVQLDRPVAVKRLREDRFGGSGGDESRQEMLRFFREEALIAARLDHPNIVPVYDYSRNAAGTPELSMKLVRGQPWDKILKRDREEVPYDDFLPRHVAILAAVANSVAFAHSRNIIHRDIKPSQVMVGEYGEVLLMDWGLAVVFGEETGSGRGDSGQAGPMVLPTLATASSPAGTPAYMAPEQTLESAAGIGPWTDVYLLGGCLYCILVGTGPYGDSPSHEAFLRAAEAAVRDPREVNPTLPIPDELANLAMESLKREPRDRIESAALFVQRLEDWISGASRRRESERMTAQIAGELSESRDRYSEYVALLNRIQQAAGLWPGNPSVPELRGRVLGEYAELALSKGDLLLAQTEAELLPDSAQREELCRRIEEARTQRARVRRTLRIAVASVFALVAVVIVGGHSSLRRIEREREEALMQKDRATGALAEAQTARTAAEQARTRAISEQIYSQVRYATSLVDAGRHLMARDVLWSIPEAERSWEWAWLMSRAHQPLAEFPFRTTEASAEGNWLYVDDGAGHIEVRDTMAGALVAKLDHHTTEILVLVPRKDTHVDTLDESRRLIRWTPPEWKPTVLHEFSSHVYLTSRDVDTDDLLLGFADNSAALLAAGTGEIIQRYPPLRGELFSLDGFAFANLVLVGSKHELVVFRRSDGVELRRTALQTPMQAAKFTAFGEKLLLSMGEERSAHLYNLADGTMHYVDQREARHGNLAVHPRGHLFFRSPQIINPRTGRIEGMLPVGWTANAQAKYVRPNSVLYWNGAEGQAGVFDVLHQLTRARLEGVAAQIFGAWGTCRSVPFSHDVEDEVERIFTTTIDGRSQVWLGASQKYHTRLPGQWGSFRRDASMAVSIGSYFATVQELDRTVPPHHVGWLFALYRSISVNEERRRIYSFGCPGKIDRRFGWEVYDMDTRSAIGLVDAGRATDQLPYLWDAGEDDREVVLLWEEKGVSEIWSTDEGRKIAEIAPNGNTPTTMLCTPWRTVLIADMKGIVRECSLTDGSIVRTVDIGTPVWALRADWKRNRLLVSGDDGVWRLYTATAQGMEPSAAAQTGAGPVVAANFAKGGTALLTQTHGGTVIVWQLPSGKEQLRFKVDGDFTRIELNAEATRIFGLGEQGLYVWDMQGREVARVPGVRDFGRNGSRMMIKGEAQLFARDLIVDVPPYQLDEYPGTPAMPPLERFELYRRSEYRDWWRRREVGTIPPSLLIAREWSEQKISTDPRRFEMLIDSLVNELPEEKRATLEGMIPLMERYATLLNSKGGHDFAHIANDLWFRGGTNTMDGYPVMQEMTRRLGPFSLLHASIWTRMEGGRIEAGTDAALVSAAVRLKALGREAESVQIARYTLAKADLLGWGPGPDARKLLQRMAGGPIPSPPQELQPMDNSHGQPPWMAHEMEKLAALKLDEVTMKERHRALHEELRTRRIAWLASVAPLPDYGALEVEARAALPPPISLDIKFGEFLGDTLDRMEQELLEGRTLPEAEADILRRFDESCAAVDREQRDKAAGEGGG